MVIKVLAILLEIIITFLLQTAVFSNLVLADVVPDLFMILTVSFGYIRGKEVGMITGFVGGLILDLTFGGLIGLYALIYMVFGYVFGNAHKIYDSEDYTFPVFFIAWAEFIFNLIYFVLFCVLNGDVNIGYFSVRYMFPRMIYTVLVSIVMYRLLNLNGKLFDKIDRHRLRKSKETIVYGGFDLIGRNGL